jgi:hypothetical protein
LAVGAESAVIEDDWDLIGSAGEMKGVFDVVADNEETLQARIDVEPINAHRMVVIEEHRGVLPAWIVIEERVAGRDPVLGIAVAGSRGATPVKVDHAADLRLVRLSTAEVVVDREKVLRRKPVLPFDEQTLATAGFNERAWTGAVESPEPGGGEIAVELRVKLLDANAIERKFLLGTRWVWLKLGGAKP